MKKDEISQLILQGDAEGFKRALLHDVDPNMVIEDVPILHLAIETENIDIFRTILEAGADVDSVNSQSNSGLIISSSIGNSLIVKDLIKYGAHIDYINDDGMTSLMAAAKFGHVSVVDILLDGGANISLRDKRGRTALHWSVMFNEEESVFLDLVEKGARIDAIDEFSFTPIDYASRLNRVGILKYFS